MSDLLIHSMSEFSEIIVPALAIAGATEIAEIGAEFGGMSTLLADFATAEGGRLTSVDPAPKPEFLHWVSGRAEVRHIAKPSLETIESLTGIDAWLIDGDHNWYTVYHELKQIDAVSRRDGRPLLVFLHDIGWPWARRDLYYAPELIPAAYRQPFDYEGGCVPGSPMLVPHRGFRGMGQFAAALCEGGPRNGVLTAIEDHIDEVRATGRTIAFAQIPAVFGLGVLFGTDAPWSEALSDFLIPYHENRLLRTLEENRLANYLAVLDWQDRAAGERQAA
jgi:hypothetical protein